MKTAFVAGSVALAMGWSIVRNAQLPQGPTRMHWGGTVFGHRGCRNVPGIPENTLDAFKYAVSRGCGGVECDVQLSKDNELVIYHDEFVSYQLRDAALVSAGALSARRRVVDCTLEELRSLPYVQDPTHQIRMPTLEESILFCQENNLRLLIDIKERSRVKLCVDKVLDLYKRYPAYMYENTVLISFNPVALYHARQRDRNVAVGQSYFSHLFESSLTAGHATLPWLAQKCPRLCDPVLAFLLNKVSPWVVGCSVICPHFSHYSATYRRRWHSRRIAIYLWGFESSTECTDEMRKPGVFISADDHHEEFASPSEPPDFDIFGDKERERVEEQRRQLKARP